MTHTHTLSVPCDYPYKAEVSEQLFRVRGQQQQARAPSQLFIVDCRRPQRLTEEGKRVFPSAQNRTRTSFKKKEVSLNSRRDDTERYDKLKQIPVMQP